MSATTTSTSTTTTTTTAVTTSATSAKIPNQVEEVLTHRLRQYAHRQCDDELAAFADCSKDKLFSVVFECAPHQETFMKCVKQYVNEENKEKLRQAYLRGELMKKKSHSDYVKELERRLQNEKMKQNNNNS